jgi:prolyl-tRNA synthetase
VAGGHTAHANRDDAMEETLRAEMYRDFAENVLALPVVAGEKPENERFPGAVATYSIEAMMQDGKALQAGTSHYLGTGFAEAAGIRYQSKEGAQELAHTTSWGVSTRMIGGVIMTHGDDDGCACRPPSRRIRSSSCPCCARMTATRRCWPIARNCAAIWRS